jgi:hypothetical protein
MPFGLIDLTFEWGEYKIGEKEGQGKKVRKNRKMGGGMGGIF